MTRDLTGCHFGSLTALHPTIGADGLRAWSCSCDCGGSATVRTSALTSLNTKSCGCGRRDKMALVGSQNATHGKSRTPEYRSWARMIHRCYSTSNNKFYLYGARGVKVCDRWRNSFETFLADMGEKPKGKPTIDRWPDNEGDYQPGNCRWASYSEQNKNRRQFTIKRNKQNVDDRHV